MERVMLITLLSDEMLGITPLMLKNQFILLLKSEGLILANPIPLQSLDLLDQGLPGLLSACQWLTEARAPIAS